MFLFRRVAAITWAANGGTSNDFESNWPSGEKTGPFDDMTKEEYREWFAKIQSKLKKK